MPFSKHSLCRRACARAFFPARAAFPFHGPAPSTPSQPSLSPTLPLSGPRGWPEARPTLGAPACRSAFTPQRSARVPRPCALRAHPQVAQHAQQVLQQLPVHRLAAALRADLLQQRAHHLALYLRAHSAHSVHSGAAWGSGRATGRRAAQAGCNRVAVAAQTRPAHSRITSEFNTPEQSRQQAGTEKERSAPARLGLAGRAGRGRARASGCACRCAAKSCRPMSYSERASPALTT